MIDPASIIPSDIAIEQVSVQSLGSGSSGNAFLVRRGQRTLLVDCGVGIRTVQREMRTFGSHPGRLDAILLTHEHSDHIRSLPKVLDAGMPVVATTGTARMADIAPEQHLAIDGSAPVEIAGFTIWAFGVRHDAVQPCGYLIETPETRITILTDLGSWQDHLGEPIAASDLIVLEANHDEEMLRRGPYPIHLKRRVASEIGHLSNRACGDALAKLVASGHRSPEVWLAHLSDTNNRPHIAEQTVKAALVEAELGLDVLALPRQAPGPVWTPSGRSVVNTPFAIPPPPRAVASPAHGGGTSSQLSLFDD